MLTLAKYMADEEERTLAAVELQEWAEDENLNDSTNTQAQARAMSLEERRLFLEERRFQMKEQPTHWDRVMVHFSWSFVW